VTACLRLMSVVCVMAALAQPAYGQVWAPPDPAEPWTNAKMKMGPIFVAPSFDLRNVGIDNNVFRDETNPKQDLTATISVNTKFGAHFKALSLIFNQDNRYLWFRRYTSERSIDGGLGGILELRTRPFRPWLSWSKAKTHERQGYEIDARAGRETPSLETGADVRFGPRTGMTMSIRQQETRYDEGEFFDEVDLKEALDNRVTFGHINGSWAYTQFTNVVGGFEWTRQKFLLNPLRSNDQLSYFAGFEARGDTPVVGKLQIGFKEQRLDDPQLKDLKEVIVHGNLTTIAADRFQLVVTGDRDISFSYDDDFPFYIENGASLTVTTRVSTRLDLITGARAELLVYSENYKEGVHLLSSRKDLYTAASLGFLYKMGGTESGSAFGLTLEQAQRASPIDGKDFNNRRVLTNIKLSF
jgi:hypothetical protein